MNPKPFHYFRIWIAVLIGIGISYFMILRGTHVDYAPLASATITVFLIYVVDQTQLAINNYLFSRRLRKAVKQILGKKERKEDDP